MPTWPMVLVVLAVFTLFTVSWACLFALGNWITEKRGRRA